MNEDQTKYMLQPGLFSEEIGYQKWLPRVTRLEDQPIETNTWDIPYTITQLSYLTHSHYRYYGKFPSAVAAQILEEFGPKEKGHYVLDNFCGSGTSLVEAKLRGIRGYGIDISWLAALASNVKTRHINLSAVRSALREFLSCTPTELPVHPAETNGQRGWFSIEVFDDLSRVRSWLLEMPKSPEREFLLIGFLGIIRRVSKAYDAEVRPHLNPDKKERKVLPAFKKKILDMIDSHTLFQEITSPSVETICYVANNATLPGRFDDGKCDLIISHPPYLNSFNYRPVFNLEFFWGAAFEHEFAPPEALGIVHDELLAHPANESIVARYFAHLESCYRSAFEIQPRNGKLAVVIGDCTRAGSLIPVVDVAIQRICSIGYRLIQRNYRTTHYGLGKYAYADRADYHGDGVEKRDAILVFEK